MKKLLTIIGIFLAVATFAQSGDDIVNALKQGDTQKFTSYFSNTVDVKFPGQNEIKNISRADASSAVTGFFSSNGIKGFDLISQREMSGTMYIAGKLTGSKSYNITVMMKSNGRGMEVITVRIS